ncbi:cell division protein FtsQ [Virgibacillus profundi]|uniref:Cell division protein DivIB n=1 Tax=Virgibacillus profundi TaxID=2024555 RepID=A0A2A2IE71_9BACI|nr:FtsQ-type POTRA domain-containing protein [Virgibacillus profundi]PAV29917.1 cell division protein FtsQ [Virgibacillus profundi]PXY54089.1 cell division protein FtsQ [Virgibacillus profundi]
MNKKKIVSIEDRIPKLKQARKKKANRRLIFYLSIFFFLISIIVYLQSPLSHVKTISVKGNSYFADEEIIKRSEITTKSNIWTINGDQIENEISKNQIVESVKVNRKLPWTIEIKVKEYERVGYIEKDSTFYPILGNGTVMETVGQQTFNGDAPLIAEFTEEAYLHKMTSELQKLPVDILNLISEIYWKPTEENESKILLYMSDGYMVDSTIRNFAEKMQVYPSIVSQLDKGSEGIIHIGVGAYFESFVSQSESEGEEIEEESVVESETESDSE